jgi:hypothetical protein
MVRVIHALELASVSLYGNFVEICEDWLAALDDFRNWLIREAA